MHTISNPETFRKNICLKLQNILADEVMSINLEKGVFNYAIKEANSKKIIKKWVNPSFTELYVNRLRTVFINLKNTHKLQFALSLLPTGLSSWPCLLSPSQSRSC